MSLKTQLKTEFLWYCRDKKALANLMFGLQNLTK
jgi:hypothetical protein